MKIILTPALLYTLFSLGISQQKNPIQFEKYEFHAGNVPQNILVIHDYVFTNISDKPVLITNATASCSCTIVNWANEPIKPGKKGIVTATYNADRVGKQTQHFTVNTSDTDKTILLLFTANVVDSK